MNITPHIQPNPIATAVNPPTDNLRRENNLREVISPPPALSKSVAEKGVASEKDRAKTPAQDDAQIDFENIRKRAEKDDSTISDSGERESNPEQNSAGHDENAPNHDHSSHDHQNDAEVIAEQQEIKELSGRDKEVRAHEMAHATVGGSTTGAPTYSYEIGPDGKKYTVSGEVSVDLSKVPGDPRATITKMQKVHAAALAPMNPSPQDRRVAAEATKTILEAQTELLIEQDDGSSKSEGYTREKDSLRANIASNDNDDFDSFVNKTLAAQEQIAPEQPTEIKARALRIENFYGEITRAYDKPDASQFLLTA